MQTGRKLLLGACGTECPLREGGAAQVGTRAKPGLARAANHSSEPLLVPICMGKKQTQQEEGLGMAGDEAGEVFPLVWLLLSPWKGSWATAKAWPEPPTSARPPPAAPTHVWGNKGEAVLLQLWKASHKTPIAWSELLGFFKKKLSLSDTNPPVQTHSPRDSFVFCSGPKKNQGETRIVLGAQPERCHAQNYDGPVPPAFLAGNFAFSGELQLLRMEIPFFVLIQ